LHEHLSIPRITVLIADDHPIFLRGVRSVLDESGAVHVVGQAHDGTSAWDLIQKLSPDVVLLDMEMPHMDAIQVARRVARQNLPTRVIVLTMHKTEDIFRQALEEGVLGYLLKDDMAADVVQCIRTVHSGQHFIAPSLSSLLLRKRSHPATSASALEQGLSPTQQQVLRLLAGGLTSKEIALELGISHRTVENHRFRITETLGLKGQNALLRYVLQKRIDSQPPPSLSP